MRPQRSLAPVYTPPEGEAAPVGLFVDGVLVRGVKAIVDHGGDVLVVLERAQLAVDSRLQQPAPCPSPLATDGNA